MLKSGEQRENNLRQAAAAAAREKQHWQPVSDAWNRVYPARPKLWSLSPHKRFPAADWIPCAEAMIVLSRAIRDAGYEQRTCQAADRCAKDGSRETLALLLLALGFKSTAPSLAERLSKATGEKGEWLVLFNRDCRLRGLIEQPPRKATGGAQAKRPPAPDAERTKSLKDHEGNRVGFQIERGRYFFRGEPFELSAKPLDVLAEFLKEREGRYLDYSHLARAVWGDYAPDDTTIRTTISAVRRSLKKACLKFSLSIPEPLPWKRGAGGWALAMPRK